MLQNATKNLPVYVFVGLYFLTTVAGNLAYLTPWGEDWPARSIVDFSWSRFSVSFGAAYWALLLMPIVLAPLVALAVRAVAAPLVERVATATIRELPPVPYALLCLVLYSYVFVALGNAQALERMTSATDAIMAVQARFDVLADLGYWPQVAMESLLVFLSIYAVVRASMGGGRFWTVAAIVNVILLSIALVLLNMKWPVVIFVLLLGFCVFTVSKRHRVLKSAAIVASGIFVYLFISVSLLRLVPATEPAEPQNQIAKTETGSTPPASQGPISTIPTPAPAIVSSTPSPAQASPASPGPAPLEQDIDISVDYAANAMTAAAVAAPKLAIIALNRMAMATPYFYDRFTTQGPICGTILSRIKRQPSPCQPSLYIYTEMFGKDGFEGIGTAPAAVNISGYALNGWFGAVTETVLAGIILGLFLALYKLGQTRPSIMAAFVMGAYAAYFMTQLPIEAAIIYPHGILWWAALLLGWSAISAAFAISMRRRIAQ